MAVLGDIVSKIITYGSLRGRGGALVLAGLMAVLTVEGLAAQDTIPAADSVPAGQEASSGGLPVFLTIGAGYGQRSDPCTQCPSPDNTDSFTGHVSLGRYLGHGLGVGVDVSVWRRGHPGPLGPADSTGAPVPTSLSNTLGNASLSFSYQLWRLYVRGGGGLAWGSQDIAGVDAEGEATVTRAAGMGIGYSAGAGVTLPLARGVSIAFFGNWNAGTYDLASPQGIVERDAKHEYLELGFGLTIR